MGSIIVPKIGKLRFRHLDSQKQKVEIGISGRESTTRVQTVQYDRSEALEMGEKNGIRFPSIAFTTIWRILLVYYWLRWTSDSLALAPKKPSRIKRVGEHQIMWANERWFVLDNTLELRQNRCCEIHTSRHIFVLLRARDRSNWSQNNDCISRFRR